MKKPPFPFTVGALMIVGWLGMIPVYLFAGVEGLAVAPVPATVGAVFYLGAVASILCFVFWNMGVEAIGAARAGLFAHLYPLFAAVLAVFFLGETLRTYHFLGGAMIFLGLALTTRLPNGAASRPPNGTVPESPVPAVECGDGGAGDSRAR